MPGTVPRSLELDLARLEVGPEGVHPFYAPIGLRDLQRFNAELLETVFDTLRNLYSREREEVELALVPVLELVRETIALFYARTLVRRARNDGVREFSIPPGFSLLRAAAAGELPSHRQRRTWRLLEQGYPDEWWKRPLRVVRNAAIRDEFARRPLPFIDLHTEIVSPAISPLIRRHARSVPGKVHLVPLRAWFQPLPPSLIEGVGEYALKEPVLTEVLRSISSASIDAGEPLSEMDEIYLSRWLADVTGLCRLYLERLLAYPERLPKRLWTGTGGMVFTRLLRLASRRQGGEVTGHEHGTASPAESVSLGLWEFEFCNRFVTFSKEMAAHYRKPHHHRYLVSGTRPEIVAITELDQGGEASTEHLLPEPRARSRQSRRLMYVNTAYFGDAPGLTPAFPDAVWVDWQARLMNSLHQMGYEVLLKPHPECPLRPADALYRLADRVLCGRFEEVRQLADAYLFDWPQTTTLVQAMSTSRPIVIIDFGFTVLEPEAEKLLLRRCAVVKGWLDEEGRAQADPLQIRKALEQASSLVNDREYYRRYQGGMEGI